MVATGARVNVLREALARLGYREARKTPPSPRLQRFGEERAEQIIELYRGLGGRIESPTLRPGGWDVAFDGGLVLELDEELHFNRYRAATLQPAWTRALPWRPSYVLVAEQRETDCLSAGRWGKRWTNPSAERLFGPADEPGAFQNGGAPRWKQRALYDAMKDSAALAGDVRLTRLSIYDDIGGLQLGGALESRAALDLDSLSALIARRTA